MFRCRGKIPVTWGSFFSFLTSALFLKDDKRTRLNTGSKKDTWRTTVQLMVDSILRTGMGERALGVMYTGECPGRRLGRGPRTETTPGAAGLLVQQLARPWTRER
ncbi:hypothetical protein H105_05772 [Trichophyton soudanense CBS 452.61]|uniref:Uncharacterized protein n=1 Tax=Trichophyton soudanense CBS 452.61 TaxID=1215331 RepID=A0A022XP29_TRISD|nr:hypothetical protein H105_05772 [Trichophyton soudanense CBS 452.61]